MLHVHSALLATALASLASLSHAQCPFADVGNLAARAEGLSSRSHLADFEVDDSEGYMTSDVGGPIEDQEVLTAGERGPTLLEDFIFRQKITHFDHERVPERAVHARGAGAHGTFTSYGDYSNITAASFLGEAGKETPIFVRFSTVAGSRGSADTARDVHGFATRFYTDEGNFDIVGNNIPVFFIQSAIQFPDLIHAVKPSPDSEVPQAATAHDSAWDFFSQQSTTLHTLLWAMAGYGLPRSYRHMDGFGVHTYRLVTDDGTSRLVKWHFKSKQGRASLVWDEAQHLAGKNPDFHRRDLWDAIAAGHAPEWELAVQVVDEEAAAAWDFDLLDPTKIIPEELAPLQPLGLLRLDANPANYFAETEQVMFQPGHIVRGVDFSDDPLLQGRIFSYLDTQLNRHGGPNFEQLPINRPVAPVRNNNRDGAAQNLIHKNTAPYSPNTRNKGYPRQAGRDEGRGFFTDPNRKIASDSSLVRRRPQSFADHWSQPRLFYNSLTPVEQQLLIDAIRFEVSHVSPDIQENVLVQLNRISHDVAVRVASTLGLDAPAADPTYYHDNTTAGLSIMGEPLPSIATLHVGLLASHRVNGSVAQATALKEAFAAMDVTAAVVAETMGHGVDSTYAASDAVAFDGIVATNGLDVLLASKAKSPLYPTRRPAQIVEDGYHWGKPIGYMGSSAAARVAEGDGVYAVDSVDALVDAFKQGLATFKFTNRFALDEES
ncbi:catalase [Emericellopsis atlantica]|uniref:Catalase n=1 Tax=Emericellopsis atlantica TaxID=2614577 RepID=A0A9P7ZKB9_9HYPO|nr:catalase [Emericellopsis atlantica]KAG9253327.1 catalase [Emericellopsis atlantica]